MNTLTKMALRMCRSDDEPVLVVPAVGVAASGVCT